MSGRKNTLLKYQTIKNGDMTGSLTSKATNIQYLDNIGLQINFTGAPVGTFSVQVSADYMEDMQHVVIDPGHWVNVTLSPVPGAFGAPDQIHIDITEISAPWIRVVYSRTGGTGTLNTFITGKML